uniref:Hypoxia-responsive family protein n=1 Tax=Solanum tuberosum TaxID=4113 RepID=M0ZTI1_SOLTU
MGSTDSELDSIFQDKKRHRNRLVPIDSELLSASLKRHDNVSVHNTLAPFLKQWAIETQLHMMQVARPLRCGAFLTAGVLTAGLISFKRGNSQLGQQLMRARVLVQGGTVALMVGSAYYYGDNFKRAG